MAGRACHGCAVLRHHDGVAEVCSIRLDVPVEGRRDRVRRCTRRTGGRNRARHQRAAPVLYSLVVVIRVRVAGIVEELREIGWTGSSDGGDSVGEALDRAPLFDLVVGTPRVFILDRSPVWDAEGDLLDV